MAATAGTVTIRLDADSARLLQELKKSNKATRRWARQTAREVRAVRRQFANLARVIGTVVAGGLFVALVSGSNKAIDALAKTADKLGLTTEALAGLRLAAEATGIASNQLDIGLQRFGRRAAEAAVGVGEAQGALRELGIDAAEIVKLPLDEQFLALADAFAEVESQSERIRLGFKLFDSEGVGLIQTLALGRDRLLEFRREAVELGVAVSRFDAAQIENANFALIRARSAVQGLTNQLAIALAGAVQLVSDEFAEWVKQLNKTEGASGFVDILARSIGALADGVRGLEIIFAGGAIFASGLFSGILEGINLLAQGVVELITGPIQLLLDTLALLPGVGSGFEVVAEGLDKVVKSINDSIEGSVGETAQFFADQVVNQVNRLNELLLKPLPSSEIERKLEAAREKARALAAEILAARTAVEEQGAEQAAVPDIAAAQEALAELTRRQAEEAAAARTILDSQAREAALRGEQELQSEITRIVVEEAQRRVAAKLEAEAAARAAAGLPSEEVSAVEQQKQIAAEIIRIEQELAAKRTKIEQDAVKGRVKAEQDYSRAVIGLRRGVFSNAIALLQSFAGKSKAAAIALIAIEKGQAIARAVMNTATAVTAALAIDPRGVLAARVKAIGAAQIALIAATGFAEASQVGSGGADVGTIANPVYTTDRFTDAGDPASGLARDSRAVQIVFSGDVYGWDEYIETRVIDAIRDAVDERDVVIIGGDSRNAQEITGTGG